jgi:glutaredoxin
MKDGMTPQEEKIIARWERSLPEKVRLLVLWKKDDPGRKLLAFCEDIQRRVPQVRVEEQEILDDSMPEIQVRENVLYSAVPEAKELEPFLQAVHSDKPLAADLGPSLRETLKGLNLPASIRIYIAPQCPFCPHTVLQGLALAEASASCRVHVIDATLFPEQAEQDGIRSVPTVILDRAFRWTGSLKVQELVNMIVHRDPLHLGSESLEQMLRSGRAEELAGMMSKRGEVFPALLDLLVHIKWPVRLGAMVTFQHLVESRPDLASQIALSLWDRFPLVDDPTKGDILFLFGESRDPSLLPMLHSVIEGSHQREVKEAARDALTNMMTPYNP